MYLAVVCFYLIILTTEMHTKKKKKKKKKKTEIKYTYFWSIKPVSCKWDSVPTDSVVAGSGNRSKASVESTGAGLSELIQPTCLTHFLHILLLHNLMQFTHLPHTMPKCVQTVSPLQSDHLSVSPVCTHHSYISAQYAVDLSVSPFCTHHPSLSPCFFWCVFLLLKNSVYINIATDSVYINIATVQQQCMSIHAHLTVTIKKNIF